MRLKITRFTKHVSVKPRSATLGFADLVAVSDTGAEIHLHDLVVRRNSAGKLSLSSPSRRYTRSDGSQQSRWRSSYRFDDVTYQRLLGVLALVPGVQEAWTEAFADSTAEVSA
ncbi:MAG: hypothetical protein GF334_04975 [Candidatus Altiarchaeales archaeon]|nr:hypothetical protein [Candidatus Altiarchaeales archaeon]